MDIASEYLRRDRSTTQTIESWKAHHLRSGPFAWSMSDCSLARWLLRILQSQAQREVGLILSARPIRKALRKLATCTAAITTEYAGYSVETNVSNICLHLGRRTTGTITGRHQPCTPLTTVVALISIP